MSTLDTNAIIYYVQDDAHTAMVLEAIYARHVPVSVSVMTEAEFFAFPHLSEGEAERIEQFLHTVSIIPMDSQIARMAAIVRKRYGLKMAESVIAATALLTGTCVVTRNVEDCRKVPQLPIEEI
jgi:predicted nucleic acid-binding protein